ncbi:MAG: PQQ-dependent sugar dehydrogenase [Tepidisphaeraceae bacterium]
MLLLGACGADDPESSPASADAPTIRLEPFIRGLERPVYLTHDGTSRLFIVEQPGRIRLVVDGQLQIQPYLDIVKKVESQGECGLLSVAFHPDFQTNGLFYVNYTTRQPKLVTIISEFHADPKAAVAELASERVLLKIDQPWPNHNGGHNLFGPDGFLYIGMGDGGSANDPRNAAQDPSTLLGKVLRIDVDQRSAARPYGIPDDNPFISHKGYRPEIWTLGMRNPWRICFDPATKLCYTGDVGQNAWEEIDVLTRGGNYGWRMREGFHPTPRVNRTNETNRNWIDPIKEYGRDLGISITGGYVYRGKLNPRWDGWYFYADYGSGRIWALKYDPEQGLVGDAQVHKMRGQPASFGEDFDRELYVCEHNGTVFKMVAGE